MTTLLIKYKVSLLLVLFIRCGKPFQRQFQKMVKHTQTICRQFADELCECV